jgi:hypothetical protein
MPEPHDINSIDGDGYAFSAVASLIDPSHTGQAYSVVGFEGPDAFPDSAWEDRRTFMKNLPEGVMEEVIARYNQEVSVAATRAETKLAKRAERRAAKLAKESLNSQSAPAPSYADDQSHVSNVSTAMQPSNTSTARPPSPPQINPTPSLAPTEG